MREQVRRMAGEAIQKAKERRPELFRKSRRHAEQGERGGAPAHGGPDRDEAPDSGGPRRDVGTGNRPSSGGGDQPRRATGDTGGVRAVSPS